MRQHFIRAAAHEHLPHVQASAVPSVSRGASDCGSVELQPLLRGLHGSQRARGDGG